MTFIGALTTGSSRRARAAIVPRMLPGIGATNADNVPRVIFAPGVTGTTSVTVDGAPVSFSVTSATTIAISGMPGMTRGAKNVVISGGETNTTISDGYRALPLQIWVRGDSVTTSGSAVTGWPNRVAGAQSLINYGGENNRPEYASSVAGLNSKGAVYFDGDDILGTGSGVASNGLCEVSMVAKLTSTPGILYENNTNWPTSDDAQFLYGAANHLAVKRWPNNILYHSYGSLNLSDGVARSLRPVYNGNEGTALHINGALVTPVASGGDVGSGYLAFGLGNAYIGARHGSPFGPVEGVTGHIAEFMFIGGVLNSAEAAAVAAYHSEYYGIAM